MFSTTVSIIVAVGLMSVVSGLVRERRSALYEAALKCTRAGLKADISALQSGCDNAAEMIEAGCKFGREFVTCIEKINPADYESPVPNFVHFLIAYAWQHQVLAKKAGLCENMHITDELKKIAVDAGVIGNGSLPNIENDTYEQCAGDAMRKCMLKTETITKEGIYQDFLSPTIDYIACYEEEGLICDAPILQHFVVFMKAYKQHLEENRAKFAHMFHEISVPSK